MTLRTLSIGLCVVIVSAFMIVIATAQRAKFPRSNQKTGHYTKAQIEHGRYLVTIIGCNDCHTPKKMVPGAAPTIDSTRLLSGHISVEKVPTIPQGAIAPDKWGVLGMNDLTAWAGPWGVSFTKNLTPDSATGLGSWTEDMFIKALRTGKDMGQGRNILPPMPWPAFGQMKDPDLKAIFAYLRSLKPVSNAVPDPLPPSTSQR